MLNLPVMSLLNISSLERKSSSRPSLHYLTHWDEIQVAAARARRRAGRGARDRRGGAWSCPAQSRPGAGPLASLAEVDALRRPVHLRRERSRGGGGGGGWKCASRGIYGDTCCGVWAPGRMQESLRGKVGWFKQVRLRVCMKRRML